MVVLGLLAFSFTVFFDCHFSIATQRSAVFLATEYWQLATGFFWLGR
jgi:hypothetical protein